MKTMFYKVEVYPWGHPKDAYDYYNGYNPLEFTFSFIVSLDDFVSMWFENYPKAYITISPDMGVESNE